MKKKGVIMIDYIVSIWFYFKTFDKFVQIYSYWFTPLPFNDMNDVTEESTM